MSIKIICDSCGNEIQSGYEVQFKVLQQESIYAKGDFPLDNKALHVCKPCSSKLTPPNVNLSERTKS
jgi:hypothetical protein